MRYIVSKIIVMLQIIINSWLIILGTLFIAGGGLMATYGWNLRSSKEIQASLEQSRIHELELRRLGIIKTVLLEIGGNISIIQLKVFTETDEKKLSKYAVYPRLWTEALSSVIESTLFLEDKSRKLFDGVLKLLSTLTDFNNTLELGNSMTQKASPIKIAYYRKGIRDGVLMQSVRMGLKELSKTILTSDDEALKDWIRAENLKNYKIETHNH